MQPTLALLHQCGFSRGVFWLNSFYQDGTTDAARCIDRVGGLSLPFFQRYRADSYSGRRGALCPALGGADIAIRSRRSTTADYTSLDHMATWKIRDLCALPFGSRSTSLW